MNENQKPPQPGDSIKVTGWPSTHGKWFVVKEVTGYDGPSLAKQGVPTVHAWEVERGGARGKLRSFPLVCVVPSAEAKRPKRRGAPTPTYSDKPEVIRKHREGTRRTA